MDVVGHDLDEVGRLREQRERGQVGQLAERVYAVVREHSQNRPALVFCNSRKTCQVAAAKVAQQAGSALLQSAAHRDHLLQAAGRLEEVVAMRGALQQRRARLLGDLGGCDLARLARVAEYECGAVLRVLAHHRIHALRELADLPALSLLAQSSDFVEVMADYVHGGKSFDATKTRVCDGLSDGTFLSKLSPDRISLPASNWDDDAEIVSVQKCAP